MRKVFTLLVAVFLTATLWAQSPEKMSYQAVIRNSSEALVTNTTVGMQISILQGSTSGTAVYVETQEPTTNTKGLVSLEIGAGTVASGDFATIDWANGPYFIKTETDPTGGTNYTITGTSQLLSVPYALHAKTAETVSGGITETDPVFMAWDKSTGISVTESQISDLGNYIETETQNLNDVLTINTSAENKNITNLATPVNAQDAATKAYVDALLARIETLEVNDLLNNGFIDTRDGNHYNVVKIGNQIWMAENLKYLPVVHNNAEFQTQGNNLQPGYGVYGYDGNNVATAKSQANYTTYGALYNWYAVNTTDVCPAGWHVPTDAEWKTLTDYLEGESVAGGKLKEAGTTHWDSPNTGATNETSFTALPGGNRDYNGSFYYVGNYGNWWSSTEDGAGNAWYRLLDYYNCTVDRIYYLKELGFSVRCVRD